MNLQIKPFQNFYGIYKGSYLIRELHKCEFKHLKKLKIHPGIDVVSDNIIRLFLSDEPIFLPSNKPYNTDIIEPDSKLK